MNDLLHLPSWLDQEAATLAGAIPPADTFADSLPAFTRAVSMTPLQRLQLIQEAGITEYGYSGEPVHLAWRRFLRGQGDSVLVIDATMHDQHSLGTAAILDKAPWLLAEGVLIAIGLRNSQKIELLLPSVLNGHEAPFLNAVDAIRSLAGISTPGREIEVVRNSKPGVWCEGHSPDRERLVHTPETWCRIALLFSGINRI